jgi:hypothetical protein
MELSKDRVAVLLLLLLLLALVLVKRWAKLHKATLDLVDRTVN